MYKFIDRMDAGKQLAERLLHYKGVKNVIILGLPRGGVPVAFEIANKIQAPMNILLVRKLGAPGNEELAIGAIAENDSCYLNHGLIAQLNVSDRHIAHILEKEKIELKQRIKRYRLGKGLCELTDKIIILVDDGVATGATCKAAITALKMMQSKKIILAMPVVSQESLKELSLVADEVVYLFAPVYLSSISEWYQHFDQVSDQEVLDLL